MSSDIAQSTIVIIDFRFIFHFLFLH
jgi:hypothetical protein